MQLKISLAGLIIVLRWRDGRIKQNKAKIELFEGFFFDDKSKADILFDIEYGFFPKVNNKTLLFSCEPGWRIYKIPYGYIFEERLRHDDRLVTIVKINNALSKGTIYAGKIIEEETEENISESIMDGFFRNFLQVFMLGFLEKKKRGIIVHSLSLKDNNKGYLFIGESGAGKSTMASFWHGLSNVRVINDDRSILIFDKNRKDIICYSSPWSGTFSENRPTYKDKTKLNRIFFMRHESMHVVRRITPQEAQSLLLSNMFHSFWGNEHFVFAIKCAKEITRAIPCYSLGFKKDALVVEYVRGLEKKTVLDLKSTE